MKIGERIAVMTEPFGRLLGKEDGEGADTGARTEIFTVSSVYYTLTRGYDPCKTFKVRLVRFDYIYIGRVTGLKEALNTSGIEYSFLVSRGM